MLRAGILSAGFALPNPFTVARVPSFSVTAGLFWELVVYAAGLGLQQCRDGRLAESVECVPCTLSFALFATECDAMSVC